MMLFGLYLTGQKEELKSLNNGNEDRDQLDKEQE